MLKGSQCCNSNGEVLLVVGEKVKNWASEDGRIIAHEV